MIAKSATTKMHDTTFDIRRNVTIFGISLVLLSVDAIAHSFTSVSAFPCVVKSVDAHQTATSNIDQEKARESGGYV